MIIKAEAILRIQGGPSDFLFCRLAGPSVGEVDTLYGDLHIVGSCCIMYYPVNQGPFKVSHGWLDMSGNDMFQRDSSPFSILVIPARKVKMRRASLHPVDLVHFIGAGGAIEDVPGELG